MNFTGKILVALSDSTWPIIRLRATLYASNAAHGKYRVLVLFLSLFYVNVESTYLPSNIGLHKAKIWRLMGLIAADWHFKNLLGICLSTSAKSHSKI